MAETTRDGTLQRVTVEGLGTGLAVAAAVSAQTLTVAWAVDFAEPSPGKPGLLRLGDDVAGIEYFYDEVDKEADTIHLTSPVTVAADEGTPVAAMSAPGRQTQRWVAWVEGGDADGDPIPAVIPDGPTSAFIEGEEQAGQAVRYVSEDSGAYRAIGLVDNDATIDGAAVWNPYVSRRAMTESIPNITWETLEDWTDVVYQGVTIEADGSVTIIHPGLYAIDAQPGFAASGTGNRYVRILVNGLQVAYIGMPADATGTTDVPVFARPLLAQGDNVKIDVFHSAGASLNIVGNSGVSPFSLYRISV